jgi:hypothetical protein
MNKRKPFFIRLVSKPSLLWKAVASMVFVFLAFTFILSPKFLVGEVDNTTRYGFGGMLLAYGAFRFYMFYSEYMNIDEDE